MLIAIFFSLIIAMFIAGYSENFSNIPFFVFIVILCVIMSHSKERSRKKNLISAIICIFMFLFGIYYTYSYINKYSLLADEFISSYDGIVKGTVLSDISVYDGSSEFYIKLSDGNIMKVKYKSSNEILPGDKIQIKGTKIFKISPENIDKNYNRRLIGDKCFLITEAREKNLEILDNDIRYSIARLSYNLKKSTFYNLIRYLDYNESATAYAMLTSDKTFLSQDINNYFIKTGTIHIATVSGFHFMLLSGMLFAIFSHIIVSYKKRIGIVIGIMSVFALYAGLSVSVLRAFFVFLVKYIADLFEVRNVNQKQLILFCMCLFLLMSPLYVYDISFILTFVATISLVFFTAPVETVYTKHFGDKRILPLSSIVVTLLMTPFIFALFGRISLTSVVANFFVDFVMSPILLLTALIALTSSFLPFLASILGMILRLLMKYFLFIIKSFSLFENLNPQIPLGILSAIFVTALIVIVSRIVVHKKNGLRKNMIALVCILVCFIYSFFMMFNSSKAQITFLTNNDCEGVVISKNSAHIVIGSASDIFYSVSSSSLRTNEPIKLWIVTDIEDEEHLNSICKLYNIEEIIAPEDIQKKEFEKYNIKYYSKDELTRCFSDIELNIKFLYSHLHYVILKYGNEEVYISQNRYFIMEDMENLNDTNILFNFDNEKQYITLLTYMNIPEDIRIFASGDYGEMKYTQISPYSVGILTKDSFEFK